MTSISKLSESIRDVLDFDTSVLVHLETTYYMRESQLHLRQHELLQLISDNSNQTTPPSTGTKEHTLEDYNNWRIERLAVATVEEKLKWNQIRRSILEKTKSENEVAREIMTTIHPLTSLTDTNYKEKKFDIWQRIRELFEEIIKEQSNLQKLWSEIVNYRAQISLANNLRAILAEHNT